MRVSRQESGQTTIEFAFVILVGMALAIALASALGFIPDFVLQAITGVIPG